MKTLQKYPIVDSSQATTFAHNLGPWFGGGLAQLGLYYGKMNIPNNGNTNNNQSFNIPYVNGKSALTEEGINFTAKELEVFLVEQAPA